MESSEEEERVEVEGEGVVDVKVEERLVDDGWVEV